MCARRFRLPLTCWVTLCPLIKKIAACLKLENNFQACSWFLLNAQELGSAAQDLCNEMLNLASRERSDSHSHGPNVAVNSFDNYRQD